MKEPKLIVKKGFKVAGYEVDTDMQNTNRDCPTVWEKLNADWETMPNVSNRNDGFGICTKFDDKGNFSYMAGMEVNDFKGLENYKTFTMPDGEYLVFEHNAPMSMLGKTYEEAEKYIQNSEYTYDMKGFQYEFYNQEFDPKAENQKFYLYFPVVKK